MDPNNANQNNLPPVPPETNQPLDPQQAQNTTPSTVPGAPAGQADDPGKTIAIVGIVFAVLFPIVGLVLSLVARSKSKNAGYSTTLPTVGLVISSLFIILSMLVTALILPGVMNDYNDIKGRATTARDQLVSSDESQANASLFLKKAEVYYVLDGEYPTALSEFPRYPESTLSADLLAALGSEEQVKAGSDKIAVSACGKDVGVKIQYWSIGTDAVETTFAGKIVSTADTCSLMQ